MTYAATPRRKAKTAASQRLPGRVKDGLLIMCFKSIEIIGEEAPSGWPLRRIFERLDKPHWTITLEEDLLAVIGVDLVV